MQACVPRLEGFHDDLRDSMQKAIKCPTCVRFSLSARRMLVELINPRKVRWGGVGSDTRKAMFMLSLPCRFLVVFVEDAGARCVLMPSHVGTLYGCGCYTIPHVPSVPVLCIGEH